MKNKNMLKTCFQVIAIVFLIVVAGCTKKEVAITKPSTYCPDKSKLLDKNWYIFAPSAIASSYRAKWGSDGNWYGAGEVPCGPYTWIDCSTFSYTLRGDYMGKWQVVAVEDNYLKFKIIEEVRHPEMAGTFMELDRVPH